jgi:hypothetical protein
MTLAAERPEVAKIKAKFGDGLLKTKVYRDELFLCVKREIIAEVLGFLKTDPELDYEYFSECLGVDYSKWLDERDLQERFEVVYNLMSITNRSRVFVKIGVNDGDKVPTCKNVFLGAEYPEATNKRCAFCFLTTGSVTPCERNIHSAAKMSTSIRERAGRRWRINPSLTRAKASKAKPARET